MDVLEAIATQTLAGIELRTDRLYMANHFVGPGVLLGDIASIQRTDSPEHLDRYDARLRAIPAFLDACAEIAREGVATGVVSPRTVVERAVAQVERIVAAPEEDAPPLAAVADDDAAPATASSPSGATSSRRPSPATSTCCATTCRTRSRATR